MTGNEPAYPSQAELHGQQDKGLTKREYFAAMAMQGVIAQSEPISISQSLVLPQNIATWSVLFADALIAELDK